MPEMERIVNTIAEKLGIKLAFYAECLPKKDVPVCDKTFEGVTDDGNYTFFRFLYKNVGYIGVLEGVTEIQRNYAALLPSYIESFAEKEADKTVKLTKRHQNSVFFNNRILFFDFIILHNIF